jgi:hypothetical protein
MRSTPAHRNGKKIDLGIAYWELGRRRDAEAAITIDTRLGARRASLAENAEQRFRGLEVVGGEPLGEASVDRS